MNHKQNKQLASITLVLGLITSLGMPAMAKAVNVSFPQQAPAQIIKKEQKQTKKFQQEKKVRQDDEKNKDGEPSIEIKDGGVNTDKK